MPDQIEIRRLKTPCHIGVPDDERSAPQTLLVTIVMMPDQPFEMANDEIDRTIDYYAVSLEVQALAASRPRKLIETLATDIAEHLLSHHALQRVSVMIEKHILPDTECVAVKIEREKAV